MLIPNSISGPDIAVSLDKLYRGDTRQILEIYVAGGDLPMGCAVSWNTSETLTAGQMPLQVILTARQTATIGTPAALAATHRMVLGIYTGKVASTPKGTANTTFLYVGTTTKVPGYHALSGEVVYVVVKGPCIAYVSGVTNNVPVGGPLTTSYGGAAADLLCDGALALAHATATNLYVYVAATSAASPTTYMRNAVAENWRIVALQASTFQSVAHLSSPVRSTGAAGTLVLINY